jgi:hypothetical protein
MSCGICYNDFKQFELISPGCCSFTICRDCVKRVEQQKCPQCRNDFAWVNQSEAFPHTVTHLLNTIERYEARNRIQVDTLTRKTVLLAQIIESQKHRLLHKCKQVCELEAELQEYRDEHDSVSDMSDVIGRLGLVIHNQDFLFRPKIIVE